MKIAKLLLMISTLASVAFAGPGPQYWQNQTKAASDTKDGVCEKCACSSKCACSADTKSKS